MRLVHPSPPPPADAYKLDPRACAAAAADPAVVGPAAAPVRGRRALTPALAVLLAGHVIRDGEVVQLILKPSPWFVLLTSLKFLAGTGILGISAKLWMPEHAAWYAVEAAAFLAIGRLMWAVLHWVNRLYILTDMRVLRLSGAFAVEVFDCPLRRVGGTRVTRTFRERLLRLGSVEVQPADDARPPGVWQTVARPDEVNRMIEDAARRAQSGGGGAGLAA
ncbi:MAG: hypothetical protein JWO31_790 [Phycisphaerales bacterium]|nr:hypothetical protein [Phycisphaerales bacterium]